jgi:hypothetical protein
MRKKQIIRMFVVLLAASSIAVFSGCGDSTTKENINVDTESKTEDAKNDVKESSEENELSNKPKDGELMADNLKDYLNYLELPYEFSGMKNKYPCNTLGTEFMLDDTYIFGEECRVYVWYEHQDTDKPGMLSMKFFGKNITDINNILVNEYGITPTEINDPYSLTFEIPDTKYKVEVYCDEYDDPKYNTIEMLIKNEKYY